MRKTFVLMALIMALSLPAAAGLVNGDWATGDETGWARWGAPWGGGYGWAVTFGGPTAPEGTLTLGGNGSFGWVQCFDCPVGNICTVSADWAGSLGGAGWAEVMLWTTNDPLENCGERADTGANGDIAFKKDSWGMNPPTTWNWQAASLSPHPLGNGGTVVSMGIVCVALKLGGFSPPEWASFDNIAVVCVPEPGSLLALGTGLVGLFGFAIRRRK